MVHGYTDLEEGESRMNRPTDGAGSGGDLRVDPEELRAMERTLDRMASLLADLDADTAGLPLGASAAAAQLRHHAGIVGEHMNRALTQMSTGVRGYGDNVRRFREDVVATDDDAAARHDATRARTENAPAVTIPAAEACAAPASITDGDLDQCTVPTPADGAGSGS